MPFKHYIRRIEGKEDKSRTREYDLVRYKRYGDRYRYGVRVVGVGSTYDEEECTWAVWADSPEAAIAAYERAKMFNALKIAISGGHLCYTSSRNVEEVDYAV